VERCLVAIGCTVVAKPDDGRLAVDVPGWRPDLVEEIDLVEEAARMHGYDNIPDELRPFRVGSRPDDAGFAAEARVRAGLVAAGLYEAMSLALTPPQGDTDVRLSNPLSADHAVLRSSLLPGLRGQVERNWAAKVRDVRLFEIGTVFEAASAGVRPREERRVAGVVTGRREPAHWAGDAGDVELWDAKAAFEAAVSLANPGATVQVQAHELVALDHSGQIAGRMTTLLADAPPWAGPLFGFEVRIDAVVRPVTRFVPLPETPSVERDLAVVVADGVSAERILAAVRSAAGALLERVDVLSEYRGEGVPAGHRSVAIHLVYRAMDRTLTDAEVDPVDAAVLQSLQTTLGARRRGAPAGDE
jgi:phenylalanyl-tRNA synthetase beta chain